MIVVDASVVVAAVAGDGADARAARSRLQAEDELLAPELLDLEVASALRRAVRAGRVDVPRAELALAAMARLPLVRAGHSRLMPRVWGLRDGLSPYDAAYVALAEALGLVLVTADARIARAGVARCPVEVLEAA